MNCAPTFFHSHREIIVLAASTSPGPAPTDEFPYPFREPAQEMGMARNVEEEAWLQQPPYAGQFFYFSGATWMLSAGWIGPTVTNVDIAQALDGNSLFGYDLGQGMHILIGRLRTPQGDACPACQQGHTPEYLHGYRIAPEQATPPQA